MNKLIRMLALCIMATIVIESPSAWAEAYCALRDPKSSIAHLFPTSTSYRSIVRVINESTKKSVEDRLPPHTLHFSELGRHTLYVPLKRGIPLGFVHVRSEESRWGLVEIAWAMDMDLRIRDFKFQRCRSSKKKNLEAEEFQKQLRGKNFQDFVNLLDVKTGQPDLTKLKIPAGAEELAEVVLKCALKTTLVTQLGWRKEIQQFQILSRAKSMFEGAEEIALISNPYTTNVTENLNEAFEGSSVGIDRSSTSIVRVFDQKDKLLGSIYTTQTKLRKESLELSWVIDAGNTIKGVYSNNGKLSEHEKKLFSKLAGNRFENSERCGNRLELMALEATITADHK